MNINYQEYERNEAYKHQLSRLTPDQQYKLNEHEGKIGRKLTPWEVTLVFNLGPSQEKRIVKRRLSDEVEDDKRWMD